MFQSASRGPPPSFFFLLRLSPSFSIPRLHISALPLLLLLSLCRPQRGHGGLSQRKEQGFLGTGYQTAGPVRL